ncbi:MAG: 23S rRNA (pseudouridine(1915)-N(3))-methyltransferase RlmH [Christensenellales bacterium]|jgi:23S rRNA (pseudouridine1915-N3)-methyltransferase
MPVTVIAVGKMGDMYAQAAQQYVTRLQPYDKVRVVEVPDQREPDKPVPALMERAMDKEGQAILSHIKPKDHVIALCIEARRTHSPGFARRMGELRDAGKTVVFVIGGSLGLHEQVLRRADQTLSLSDMTFPHQLARVMLLEQIYRGYKILAGERYHK